MSEIEVLTEPGRINCEGNHLLYQLLECGNKHLLKFYNQKGKVKLIRPIIIPPAPCEIHAADNYLLWYKHNSVIPTQSYIQITELSNCLSPIFKCQIQLDMPNEAKTTIRLISVVRDIRIILFSDWKQRVYAVKLGDKEATCSMIFESQVQLSRIQLCKQQRVMLIGRDSYMIKLTMDWNNDKILDKFRNKNVVDHYEDRLFEITLAKGRDWHNNTVELNSVNYYIDCNEDKYSLQCSKDTHLIYYSDNKSLIAISKQENWIFTLYNEVFRLFKLESADYEQASKYRQFLANVSSTNFLVNFKSDISDNVHLDITLMIKNEVLTEPTFKFYTFPISRIQGENQAAFVFLKRNIQTLINMKGLPQPIFYQRIEKSLKKVQQFQTSSFQKSKQLDQRQSKQRYQSMMLDSAQIGQRLIKMGLQLFPQSLTKIIKKIKANIRYNNELFYIQQTQRFFSYCEYIQNQAVNLIIKIAQSIDTKSPIKSFDSIRDKDIKQTIILMQNMINFLYMFINELKVELQEQIYANKTDIQHHKPDKLKKQMKYNQNVLNKAKSMFLIAKMLSEKDIVSLYTNRMKDIQKSREDINLNFMNNTKLVQMNYHPLFPHQHFQKIQLMTLNSDNSDFVDFFKFLLQNRQNLLQIAYFYQSIIRIPSTPYIPSDISDLIQNICFHLPVIINEQQFNQNKQARKSYIDLLHKMANAVLNTKQFTYTKYLIQLAITYKEYALAVLLIHSGSFQIQSQNQQNYTMNNIFVVKSLILAGRLDLAHLHVIKHHSDSLFLEMVKLAQINGHEFNLIQKLYNHHFTDSEEKTLHQQLNIDQQKWQQLHTCFIE